MTTVRFTEDTNSKNQWDLAVFIHKLQPHMFRKSKSKLLVSQPNIKRTNLAQSLTQWFKDLSLAQSLSTMKFNLILKNKKLSLLAQTRSTTHSTIFSEAVMLTMAHLLCKLHHSWTIDIKSKPSLWWTHQEACSTLKIKRERSPQYSHQSHASLIEKQACSEWEETTITRILLSARLTCSHQRFNHHQLILVEFSSNQPCKTFFQLWTRNYLADKIKPQHSCKSVQKRIHHQCSCKLLPL